MFSSPSEALILLAWIGGYHMAVALALRLFVAVGCGLSARWVSWRVDPKSVALTLFLSTLALFVMVNGILAFPIAYSPFRQRGVPLFTPSGLGALLVLVSIPMAAFWVGQKWWEERRFAFGFAMTWGLLTVGFLAWSHAAAQPVSADLEQLDVRGERAVLDDVVAGDSPKRVLVLGLDGMSWHVVKVLLSQERAPHLAGLIEVGTRANLRSFVPTLSASIWNTIATGLDAEAHGITGMNKYRLPGMTSYLKSWPRISSMNSWNGISRAVDLLARLGVVEKTTFHQPDRKAPALWDLALHHGQSVGVVNWWATWPALPMDSDSYMVSKPVMGPGGFSSPSVERLVEQAPPLSPVFGQNSQVLLHPSARGIWTRTEREMSVANTLFAASSPDLAMHYSHYVDGLHHRLWKGGDPSLWHSGAAAFPEVLLDAYEEIDHWLGTHLEQMAPDTLVLLVSDHGYSFDGHEHHFAPDGVFLAVGPGVKANHLLEGPSVYDIAPTILAALGLPVPENMVGAVLEDLFEPGALAPVVTVPEPSWYTPKALDTPRDAEMEQGEIEFLRSLGYVN